MRLRLVRLACHCRQVSGYSKPHFYLYTIHPLATSTHITNALYCPPHQCQMQPSTMTTRRMLLQVKMLYLSLLTFTLLGLSCALSLPSTHPTLPLALPDAFNTSNITSLSRNVNNWPPAPVTYAFYGLTIDINAYFSGPTPHHPQIPSSSISSQFRTKSTSAADQMIDFPRQRRSAMVRSNYSSMLTARGGLLDARRRRYRMHCGI